MKEILKQFLFMAAFVVFALLVFRGIEWIIPSPPAKVIICIEDSKGEHDCSEYKTSK